MTTEAPPSTVKRISVSGFMVEIIRKDIKNLHLGVYPPLGRVRVAAPLVVSDEAVRLAVIDKLGWIKRQRAQFVGQPRQSEREMVNGESHYFQGRRYRLRVHEQAGPTHLSIRGVASLDLYVRPGATEAQRLAALARWYRESLREQLATLIPQWEKALGVQAHAWGIKKMKTRWGSCNAATGRIWLNLELAKSPPQCLEYIVVHELLHLLERHHNDHFICLLDQHLPDWRSRRALLNRAPLGHVDWEY